VGGRAKFNNYFTEQNQVTKTTPTASSYEVLGALNLHITHHKNFNWLVGTHIGYSALDYRNNDPANNIKISGTGSFFDMHTTARVYIRRFGFHLSAYLPYVNYNKMTSNNDIFNNYILAKWKGNGFGMNIGIQYRFFSVRKDVIR
jgi:hypothetical protein